MQYLYHRVPENLEGEILYPLNELKNIYPDLYATAVKKYEGREFVMDQKVPTLDCLWNDVIHMSAVHPQKIEDELLKHGESFKGRKFFQIDPHLLKPEKTTIFLFRHNTEEEKFMPANWATFDPDDLEQYSVFPERTAHYYSRIFKEGGNPLLWVFVPHIMYKGSIDTNHLEIIEVE